VFFLKRRLPYLLLWHGFVNVCIERWREVTRLKYYIINISKLRYEFWGGRMDNFVWTQVEYFMSHWIFHPRIFPSKRFMHGTCIQQNFVESTGNPTAHESFCYDRLQSESWHLLVWQRYGLSMRLSTQNLVWFLLHSYSTHHLRQHCLNCDPQDDFFQFYQ